MNLSDWLKKCACSDPISEELDATLLKYLQVTAQGGEKSSNYYAGQALPFLDKKIQGVTAREIALLDELMQQMIDEIGVQVREQMDAFRDVSGTGLYYD